MGFHIVKRENCPLWKKLCFYLLAIVLGLGIGAILLISKEVDPIEYYIRVFTLGSAENVYPEMLLMNFYNKWVPLALTAVALSLSFKMRFWNIGGEGQFIMGAIAATYIGFKCGHMDPTIVLVLMCLGAMIAAGLYGIIAALLKVKFGTNETLLTLMLNYIALYFLQYIAQTKEPWNIFLQKNSPRPVFESLATELRFPSYPAPMVLEGFELSLCVILVVVISLLLYVYLRHTKQGYEISVVGDSANTARYAGMKVNWIVLRTVFLSASLIGLAASFKIGTSGTLSETITEDVGWTGIIVAWLAQLNTIAILFVSYLICMLQFGSVNANVVYPKIDANFANILQSALLFLVLAADFMIRFRIVRTRKGDNK